MAQSLIIADDLTGANATGVLLHKTGFSADTIIDFSKVNKSELVDFDCLLYPTGSRSISPDEAYKRVYEATKFLKSDDTKVYAKRIDSTLRGNIGQETDAMLDALGEEYVALIAPSFPSSGRIVCGGYMLVNSIPLHKTAVAKDPKNPVHTSSVEEIFRSQSKYKVASITIGDLLKGKQYVIDKILDCVKNNVRNICFDGVTDDDLDFIADCSIESKVSFINVGPGPFTASVVKKTITPKVKNINNGSILIVIGSINPITKMQVEEILPLNEIYNITFNTNQLLKDDKSKNEEIEKITKDILSKKDDYKIFAIIGDGLEEENKIDLFKLAKEKNTTAENLSNIINTSFAKVATNILKENKNIKAIYTSGGDITVAICDALNVVGIRLRNEILPLAAYGELRGSEYDGLQIITKGGMAGDKYALKDCLSYLKTHI